MAPTVIPIGIRAWPDDPGGAELGPFALLTDDVLVAFLSWNGVGNPLISFTWNGLPLTKRAEIQGTSTIVGIWTLNVPASATATLASFMTETTDGIVSAMIVRNAPAAPYDVSAKASGTGTTPSSGSTTTTQPTEVAFAVVTTDGPQSDSAGSWDNGFVDVHRLEVIGRDASHTQSTAYKFLTSTGAVSAAKTGITSRAWNAVVATLVIPSIVSVTGTTTYSSDSISNRSDLSSGSPTPEAQARIRSGHPQYRYGAEKG